MRVIRATLIQCITELQACLKPALDQTLERYSYSGVTYEDALEWILAEEIELIYMLFDERHGLRRTRQPYAAIYQELKNLLTIPLSRYVSYYVAAPMVYSDYNEIRLRITGLDLYIEYFREPYAHEPVIRNYSAITK